jgi:hypothetical protein
MARRCPGYHGSGGIAFQIVGHADARRVSRRVHVLQDAVPPLPLRQKSWPLNQQPPDAETRRALDIARREIASSRSEIARFLRSGAV